jgi:hypothetical protein
MRTEEEIINFRDIVIDEIRTVSGNMDRKRKLNHKDIAVIQEAQIIANILNWTLGE